MTLIEIIVVIMILAVLASISAPRFSHMIENQRAAAASVSLKSIFLSQRRHFIDHDSYATAIGDLDVDPSIPLDFLLSLPGAAGCSAPSCVAKLERSHPNITYNLTINNQGVITCSGANCSDISPKNYGQ